MEQQQKPKRKITLKKKPEKAPEEQQQKPKRKITLKKTPEKAPEEQKTEEEIIESTYDLWKFRFSFNIYTAIPKDATDVYYKWGTVYFTQNNIKKEIGVGDLFDFDYKWADSEEKLIDSPLEYGFDCLTDIENSIIDKN